MSDRNQTIYALCNATCSTLVEDYRPLSKVNFGSGEKGVVHVLPSKSVRIPHFTSNHRNSWTSVESVGYL